MFTKKELKLIEEALLAYGIEPEETKIYSKIDKLINKPVETTNEKPNLEIQPEYFKELNNILGSYYEMFEDDEVKEDELALVEILQDRIDFLEGL